jgi:hypothetical protein
LGLARTDMLGLGVAVGPGLVVVLGLIGAATAGDVVAASGPDPDVEQPVTVRAVSTSAAPTAR